MCVYLHFTLNCILHFLSAISRRSQCQPLCQGVVSCNHPWPLRAGDPLHCLGILTERLGFSCLNSIFSTKSVITKLPLPTSFKCSTDEGKCLCGKKQEIFKQAEWVFL